MGEKYPKLSWEIRISLDELWQRPRAYTTFFLSRAVCQSGLSGFEIFVLS